MYFKRKVRESFGFNCPMSVTLQEIYPPKIHQLAYVTDEACTEDEILSMEIIIMKVKLWSLFVSGEKNWELNIRS